MPCKIKIKGHLENIVAEKSAPGLTMSLPNAKVLATDINMMYNHHVVDFKNENNKVARVINIPSELVNKYYDKQIKEDIVSFDVKEEIKSIYEQNPELASIGTPEQYSAYLDSIFPNSKVKDIVYRGAEKGIQEHKAYSHWTLRKALADNFAKQGVNLDKKDESKTTVYAAVLDVRNLIRNIEITDKSLKEKGYDSAASFPNEINPDTGKYYSNEEASEAIKHINKKYNNEITVFTPEQIHVLGSEQDIEGFKNFVNKNINSTDKLNADLNSLNLTEDVVNYLYTTSRSKSKGVSLNTYNKEVQKLIGNLRSDFTNQEILEKIKCL